MHTGKKYVFCVCQPMLDLRIRGSDTLIQKYKLPNNGYIELKSLPSQFSELEPYNMTAGGSALNTLRLISAWSDLPTFFVGAVGDDRNGKLLKEQLDRGGVINNLEVIKKYNTAICYVFIYGINRSLATYLGAANQLTLFHFNKCQIYLSQSKYVYITGFMLQACPLIGSALLNSITDQRIFLNLSATAITTPLLMKAYFLANYVIGNKDEYNHLLGINLENNLFLEKKRNFEFDQKVLIITNGPKDTIYFKGNKQMDIIKVKNHTETLLDTCGAGDAFAAGFIAGIAKDLDIGDAIREGHKWAYRYIDEMTTDMKRILKK
ncbi:Adenosine kinase [Astathelohania contejeani]|uniref:Adenosine kinase n=1 Tax=Astathelohania contejeani TaxID=164912 RepID=A0ABQ7I202_9MICR|nr:Adenosine kinase [Thelohania contejeani]